MQVIILTGFLKLAHGENNMRFGSNFRDIRHIKFIYLSFISSSEKGLIESQLVYLRGNSSAAGLDMREQAKS